MPLNLSPSELTKARTWYVLGGGLSALVGLVAIARPDLASVAIEQFLGLVFIVSGVALLISAVFSKAKKHRVLDILSSALRLGAGILLIAKVLSGLMALTVVVASIFVVEGVFSFAFALKLRGKNPAWTWVLLNALAAFVLAAMLFAHFPSDAAWAVGLLFGINSVFIGVSLIMFGLALPKAEDA